MKIEINKNLYSNKVGFLKYLRDEIEPLIKSLNASEKSREDKAKEVNRAINDLKENAIKEALTISKKEKWSSTDILNNILMIAYCSNIVMIESRNKVWAYEYMAFARRIGELWEDFCSLCWIYNPNVEIFNPPSFQEVRTNLENEIRNYINGLEISKQGKEDLMEYYSKVWNLLTSGEINLSSDLHFKVGDIKYITDLKSGFSSNEKGNTNRLLLVASIYKSLNKNYDCLIFVRSAEDEANHYLQTLKNSKLWKVYCSDEAYDKMKEYTKFDIKKWIKENMDWINDFDKETMKFFKDNRLDTYLKW